MMNQKYVSKSKKKSRRVPIALFVIIFCLIFAVTVSAFAITNSEKSFPNLYVGSIPIGKMTRSEILSVLSDKGWEGRANSPIRVETFCNVNEEINPVSAGFMIDCDSAADIACKFGKDASVFKNLISYIKCIFEKNDINEINSSFNENYIDSCAIELQKKLDLALGDDSYVLDVLNCELKIIKGYSKSLNLDKELLKKEIIKALENGTDNFEFRTLERDAEKPDFNLLHELVCTEPADAAFSTDGSHEVIETVPGYSFDVSEAEKLWDSASVGEEIVIPLKESYSDVTKESLESMEFVHLLGAMTTKYNNSSDNRCSNVRLATSLVNGTVVFPGEEFSFNEVVGKRTEEAGFLSAPAYMGYDDIQEEIGGGVCQVSSGIYASALFAFLDITAHTCHVYPPNYMQLGTDATVSIPASGRAIDLKFVNNRNWPVKIIGYCEEGENPKTGKPLRTCTIEIWGTLEDDDYMPVEFDNAWGDVYDYDRKIEPAYPDREGYRLQFTHDETEFEDDTGKGLRTLTYRRVYDSDGNVVEKKILNKEYSFGYGMDTYYYKQ